MKFNKGEVVDVKVPRTSLTVQATIISVNKSGGYLIEYEGGAISEMTERNIKSRNKTPTPKRSATKNQSPSRSVTKNQSPSRSATRNQSPSRKVSKKSPTRNKSPSRGRRSSPRRGLEQKVPEMNLLPAVVLDKNIADEIYLRKRNVNVETLIGKDNDRILHLKPSVASTDFVETVFKKRYTMNDVEFGGTIGVLFLMMLFTTSLIVMHLCCNIYECNWTWYPSLVGWLNVDTWLSLNTSIVFCIYCLVIAVLTRLNIFGRKVEIRRNNAKEIFYANSIFIFLFILTSLIGLEYYDIGAFKFMYDNYLQFFGIAFITGWILPFLLSIRKHVDIPAEHMKKGFIYDFYMGKDIDPKPLGLDIKMYLFRLSTIGTLMINIALLIRGEFLFQPTLCVACLLSSIFLLDNIFWESSLIYSHEIGREGVGWMMIFGNHMYPFMISVLPKYICEHEIHHEDWYLCMVLLIYIVGFVILKIANSQKMKFRAKPYGSNMRSIPSVAGGLLTSGLWGYLRHPNYLGDIIMHTALLLLVPYKPAALQVICTIMLLLHRASRDNVRIYHRHGHAYEIYKKCVRFNIIPFVY